jgi:DNA-binding transcriptional MerR regulator
MMPCEHLRTIDLARSEGMSVQQVRNYETWGFLPLSQRNKSGYRLYTSQHLAALKTARSMIGGYGWKRALNIMQAVHQGNLSTALALVDTRHAELASKRLQVGQTLEALWVLSKQSIPWTSVLHSHKLRIGEAAKRVGVRTSALHFWEQQGLLHPVRDQNSRYRLYDERQVRGLQVVVLLREAGYDFGAIRSVLDEMALGQPEKAIQAVEKRSEELDRMSWTCIEAMSSFQKYIRHFCPEISSSFITLAKEELSEPSPRAIRDSRKLNYPRHTAAQGW